LRRFTFQQEDVSIYEFYAEIGGKKIVSVCKEKEAAFNLYDDSISAGHGGYLLDKGRREEEKRRGEEKRRREENRRE
jgi:Vault protein inter-alpha-trypsin domain